MSFSLRLPTSLASNFKALFSIKNRLRALNDAGRCHVGHKNANRLHAHGSACTLAAATQDVALDCAATGIGDSQYIIHNIADHPVLILKSGIIYRANQRRSAFYCVISKILNSLWTASNVHSSVCRAVNMSKNEFHVFKAFTEAK
jgi:hypothetical protein